MSNARKLIQELKPAKDLLLSHKIYESVKSLSSTQVFMKNHSFAVWDFMSLLKSMQQKITVTTVPWVPTEDSISAYLVNSIVQAEESDTLGKDPSNSISHYELYLEAMNETGGFSEPIKELVKNLTQGIPFGQSLKRAKKDYSKIIPDSTFEFIEKNVNIAVNGSLEQVVSFFIFGREDPIPEMFAGILHEIEKNNLKAEKLKVYLERHIHLDGKEHGPLSMDLLNRICGENSEKWKIVLESAKEAIFDRIKLWDGILLQLGKKPTLYEAAGGFYGIFNALSEHREDILIGGENINRRIKDLAQAIGSVTGGPVFENRVFNSGRVDYEEAGEVIGNEARFRKSGLSPHDIAFEVNKMKGLLKARV